MALTGLITTEGLGYTMQANSNQGWFIYPTKVGISDTAGAYSISRTILTLNPFWDTRLISGYTKVNNLSIEMAASIPPNQNGNVQTVVAELAYFAETQPSTFTTNAGTDEITVDSLFYAILVDGDQVTFRIKPAGGVLPVPVIEAQTYWIRKYGSNKIKIFSSYVDATTPNTPINLTVVESGAVTIQKEFLLGIAQPNPAVDYFPDMGTMTFRPTFVLANSGDTNLFTFVYTQAADILTHNDNANSHPFIQDAINKAGIFTQTGQVDYKGQSFDELPVLGAGVTEAKAVYLAADGQYKLAVADGSIKELNFIGFLQDGIVKSNGYINIGIHGFTPIGSKVYLHGSTPGALTLTPTTTEVGIVLNTNTIIMNKKYLPVISAGSFVSLSDTPSAYAALAADANKLVAVNNTGDGIVFVDPTAATIPVPTETTIGITTIATTTQVNTGTDDTTIITPLKLANYISSLNVGSNIYSFRENFKPQIPSTTPFADIYNYNGWRINSSLSHVPVIDYNVYSLNWNTYTGDKIGGMFHSKDPSGTLNQTYSSSLVRNIAHRQTTTDYLKVSSTLFAMSGIYSKPGSTGTLDNHLNILVYFGTQAISLLFEFGSTGSDLFPSNSQYRLILQVIDGVTNPTVTSSTFQDPSTSMALFAEISFEKIGNVVTGYLDGVSIGSVSTSALPNDVDMEIMANSLVYLGGATYFSAAGRAEVHVKNIYLTYNP